MRTADLTLDVVKKSPVMAKAKRTSYRLSDFVDEEDLEDLETANIMGRGRKGVEFDAVDKFCAEVIARFGYDTYKAWLAGEISMDKMMRFLEAERCRDNTLFLGAESVIVAAVSSCAQGKRGIRVAQKIVRKQEQEAKKGGR